MENNTKELSENKSDKRNNEKRRNYKRTYKKTEKKGVNEKIEENSQNNYRKNKSFIDLGFEALEPKHLNTLEQKHIENSFLILKMVRNQETLQKKVSFNFHPNVPVHNAMFPTADLLVLFE